MSSNNKLKRRGSFAYYEPLALRQRPKQDFVALCPTTGNLITEAATTQGKQEIMTSQDIAATPASSVPSTQPATTVTAAPGKWPANQRVHIQIALRGLFLESPENFSGPKSQFTVKLQSACFEKLIFSLTCF